MAKMEPASTLSIPVPSFLNLNDTAAKDARDTKDEEEEEDQVKMTPKQIARFIDQRARIAFPAVFIFTNILYWAFIWF